MRIDAVYSNPYTAQAGAAQEEKARAADKLAAAEAANDEAQAALEEVLAQEQAAKQDEVDITGAKEETGAFDYKAWAEAAQESKFEIKTSPPSDNTAQLTARLVSASAEMSVRAVMIEAGQSMMGLRLIAAIGSKEDQAKAKAILAKLDKLIDRAQTKIKSLREEDTLQHKVKRAEQDNQRQRAAEIKAELRRQQQARRAREQRWLEEAQRDQLGQAVSNAAGQQPATDPSARMDAFSEAQIAALAEAMAAAEVAAAGTAAGGEGGVAVGTPAGGAEGGAQAAGGGGGDGGGGGEVAASVDVTA